MLLYSFITVLGLYLLATLFYLVRLLTKQPRLSAIGLRLTVIAALLQFVTLVFHFFSAPSFTQYGYLGCFQISSLILALIFITLCFTKKYYTSGPFFLVLIVVFNVISFSDSAIGAHATTSLAGLLYTLHFAGIFLCLSVLSVSFISALMFLLSEKQIKQKRFEGVVAKFPALADLESTHDKALYFGFILFTLVIISGAGFAKIRTGHYIQIDNIRQVLSLFYWILFAFFLNLRVMRGWQGHKNMLLSLLGFSSMVLLFIIGLS